MATGKMRDFYAEMPCGKRVKRDFFVCGNGCQNCKFIFN